MCICNQIKGHNNQLHNNQLKSYILGTNCTLGHLFRLSKYNSLIDYCGPFPIAVVLFSHVVLGNNYYLICYITIPILVQVRIHDTR